MFDLSESTRGILIPVASTLLATGILSLLSWLTLETRFNKKLRTAWQHLEMAEALQKEGQFSDAKDELIKTIALLSDEERSFLLSQAYMRLGDVSMLLRDWDAAIRSFILCGEIGKHVRHGTSEDVILLRLGKAYFASGKFEDAFRCFDEARRIEEKHPNHPLLGETFNRLGEIEAKRQHPEAAINYYSRAVNFHVKIGDKRSVAAAHFCLGDLNLKIANLSEAQAHLLRARDEYSELGDFPLLAILENKLAQARKRGKAAQSNRD
jgi:tetratricopeptide (TPR) repeat protein